MTKKKKVLFRIGLIFFGLLIGLIICEGAARITYTKPWYSTLIEEQTKDIERPSIKTNTLGLRGNEFSPQKLPNSKRVLILGDSFTFGNGLADDAAIFPTQLQKQINADWAGRGMTVEILNGGIGGSLTDQWVDLLLRLKDSSQLDAILIVFFLRDGTKTSSMGSFFGPLRDEIKAKNSKRSLYRYSYLFRWFQDSRDRTYLSKKYSQTMNESYFGGSDQTQEWEIAKTNILKIKAIGEGIGAKVGLVVFPVLAELNEDYPFKGICDVVAKFGTDSGLPTHNLLSAFMGRNGPDLWVSPYNQHPNAEGHKIAADSMLPFLKQLLDGSSVAKKVD